MCAIAGFYSDQDHFKKEELSKMLNAMEHRGPDAQGEYHQSKVALGHNRLSIIDLSESANQPFYSSSQKNIVVFNGEIYNFQAIKQELSINFKTQSDTEVIVEAFEKWGDSFVNKLNGMFAIAIYNVETKRLHLFRDRMGIKPLFYYYDGQDLAFASELKALVQLPFIQKNLNIKTTSIKHYLHLGYIPTPDTIYNHIYKFPQGHKGVFDGKTLTTKVYWDITKTIQPSINVSYQEQKEKLRTALNHSISSRLVADVPFGAFLSGGIDSSLICALAQQESTHTLKTFSIGFSESKFNELDYAEQVAKHLKTNHKSFILTTKDALDLLPNIFTYYDEPFADTSAIPTMLVSKMAKQDVTMTLSGDGGDELFHGYGMYDWAERLNNPLFKLLKYPLKTTLKQLDSRYKRVAHLFDWQNKTTLKSHLFSQEQYFFSQKEIQQLINPKIKGTPPPLNEHPQVARNLTHKESQALFDLMYYLPDDLLTKVDRASMVFSLESRVPFLDHNVVELALNTPVDYKVKNNEKKYILKDILYDYVPKSIFERPKWGFSIPLSQWLNNELHYLIDDFLSREKIEEAGFVQFERVQFFLNQYLSGQHDYLYNRIWLLISLHKWYCDIFKKIMS